MRFATWNVNSVKARLPRLLSWLEATGPDVVCLQETKSPRRPSRPTRWGNSATRPPRTARADGTASPSCQGRRGGHPWFPGRARIRGQTDGQLRWSSRCADPRGPRHRGDLGRRAGLVGVRAEGRVPDPPTTCTSSSGSPRSPPRSGEIAGLPQLAWATTTWRPPTWTCGTRRLRRLHPRRPRPRGPRGVAETGPPDVVPTPDEGPTPHYWITGRACSTRTWGCGSTCLRQRRRRSGHSAYVDREARKEKVPPTMRPSWWTSTPRTSAGAGGARG